MVRVEMGEECRLDSRHGKTHALQLADRARAGIEDESLVSGQDGQARSGAVGIGHRRTGAADVKVQAICESGGLVDTYGLVESGAERPLCQPATTEQGKEPNRHSNHAHGNREFPLHPKSLPSLLGEANAKCRLTPASGFHPDQEAAQRQQPHYS